jgi:hypothetical protein
MLRHSVTRLNAAAAAAGAAPVVTSTALRNAVPFSQALLAGRLSESRIDAFYFDRATANQPNASETSTAAAAGPTIFRTVRESSSAALRSQYALTGDPSAGSPSGIPFAKRPLLGQLCRGSALTYPAVLKQLESAASDLAGAIQEAGLAWASPDALPPGVHLSGGKLVASSDKAGGMSFNVLVPSGAVNRNASRAKVVLAAPVDMTTGPAGDAWKLVICELPITSPPSAAAVASGAVLLNVVIPSQGAAVVKTLAEGTGVRSAVARASTAARVSLAGEITASLDVLLDALVQHATVAVEFGKILADSEAAQQRLSLLASTVYAIESTALVVEGALAANPADASAGAEDSALLALLAQTVAVQRVSEAIVLMNPSLIHLDDETVAQPARFRFVKHLADAIPAVPRALGEPAPAAMIALSNALPVAVPSTEVHPIVLTMRGKSRYTAERAARDFPVSVNLRLPSVTLSDDAVQFRNDIVQYGRGQQGPTPVALGAWARVAAELYGSSCAAFRSSAVVDRDDLVGYSEVLKTLVFLEDSALRRRLRVTVLRRCLGRWERTQRGTSRGQRTCRRQSSNRRRPAPALQLSPRPRPTRKRRSDLD